VEMLEAKKLYQGFVKTPGIPDRLPSEGIQSSVQNSGNPTN